MGEKKHSTKTKYIEKNVTENKEWWHPLISNFDEKLLEVYLTCKL